jgi:hypothetical protein
MKKFLAVIPYFGGTSSAPRQTELNNVLRYFEYTYSSLKSYMTKLIVSVYNDEDYETLRPFSLNADIELMRITDIDPIFLPANTVRSIQKEGFDEECVYFTESDQIFYAQDINNLYKTIDYNKNVYIVPQRFEQIPRELVEARINKFEDTTENRFVEFEGALRENDNPYVVANEPVTSAFRSSDGKMVKVNQVYEYDEHFYINPAPATNWIDSPEYGQAYGAAFLCHRDLFNRVKFMDAKFKFTHKGKKYDIEYQPTETTAGHDLLRTEKSICLKSKDFFYFHVDHLSGYEFNKKL